MTDVVTVTVTDVVTVTESTLIYHLHKKRVKLYKGNFTFVNELDTIENTDNSLT